MRQLLFLALLALLFAGPRLSAADKDEPKGSKVAFDVHEGYVEKKDSGLAGTGSFLIFFDFPSFKKIFTLSDAKDAKAMPGDTFNTKQVFALIKRSDKPWTYKVDKVLADGDKLSIYYEAEAGEGKEGTKYASPLILSVKKKVYNKIAFFENGKEVGGIESKGSK